MRNALNSPIKAGHALVAFALLAAFTYFGFHSVLKQDAQRSYDNTYSFCVSGNQRLVYQKSHVVRPLEDFIKAGVRVRKEQALASTTAKDKRINTDAVAKYSSILGRVHSLPPRDCASEIQRP